MRGLNGVNALQVGEAFGFLLILYLRGQEAGTFRGAGGLIQIEEGAVILFPVLVFMLFSRHGSIRGRHGLRPRRSHRAAYLVS